MSDELMNVEPVRPGRRRRYTPEQKRALLDHAAAPGGSFSDTARTFGVAPSLLFQWKRVMDDATKKGLKANEQVVPKSELKKAEARIRELERALAPWLSRPRLALWLLRDARDGGLLRPFGEQGVSTRSEEVGFVCRHDPATNPSSSAGLPMSQKEPGRRRA